ncbi:hypothetical protein IMF27_18915 [Pseudomonas sp. PCH199]|uniref:hypothetical protein n=1 Tax=unclassified Pseudomonas TaxID=196821 RepID=UPI000BDAF8BA|nr:MULTISPECIES: hypothetical protein [unclassified Pseudomonas]MCW8277446.1 hypothetical protein [Pseudomonas sp. PCH199]PAM82384.1 hypothetical protein CES87_19295 [Pseudomonas sp. ERMR1:02]
MADEAINRTKIIDLDNFGITKNPYNSDLYTEVYDMMIGDSLGFREQFLKLKATSEESEKTLIVTEGKTDIQHLRAAAKSLGCGGSLNYFDVPADWGDSKLERLLEQLSKLKQRCTVIGVFDRDVEKIVAGIEVDGRTFKIMVTMFMVFACPYLLAERHIRIFLLNFFIQMMSLKNS